jgi:hypothetical protein
MIGPEEGEHLSADANAAGGHVEETLLDRGPDYCGRRKDLLALSTIIDL